MAVIYSAQLATFLQLQLMLRPSWLDCYRARVMHMSES